MGAENGFFDRSWVLPAFAVCFAVSVLLDTYEDPFPLHLKLVGLLVIVFPLWLLVVRRVFAAMAFYPFDAERQRPFFFASIFFFWLSFFALVLMIAVARMCLLWVTGHPG